MYLFILSKQYGIYEFNRVCYNIINVIAEFSKEHECMTSIDFILILKLI